MDNIVVTLDVIKETGFDTWTDFYLALVQSSVQSRLGDSDFSYMKNNQEKSIQLPLSHRDLESLAYYESLDQIKPFANSFRELLQLTTGDGSIFSEEFVTRAKNGTFEVHKFSMDTRDIKKLVALEQIIHIAFFETTKQD